MLNNVKKTTGGYILFSIEIECKYILNKRSPGSLMC